MNIEKYYDNEQLQGIPLTVKVRISKWINNGWWAQRQDQWNYDEETSDGVVATARPDEFYLSSVLMALGFKIGKEFIAFTNTDAGSNTSKQEWRQYSFCIRYFYELGIMSKSNRKEGSRPCYDLHNFLV